MKSQRLFPKISNENINPSSGFNRYGIVKNDYILLKGSVAGPQKRAIILTEPIKKIEPKSVREISLQELSIHNLDTDCWVSYKKDVFDISDFLNKHPGGKPIIRQYCGTAEEFEKAFTKKHVTTKVLLLKKVGVNIGILKQIF